MTDHYAVMGNPIAHSKSPRIHALFAEQTGAALDYRAILVEIDGFAQAVSDFRANGGKGLNVTVPFKEQAWALSTSRSTRAELAGAVNTLSLEGDKAILGDNTDGAGLVRDLLQNHGARLAGRRILLLGAGGAARGVIGPLLDEKPALLVIANRTAEKAVELARLFCELGHTEGCGLDDAAGQPFDIIINATAASLSGTVPAIAGDTVTPGTRCYDMMYGDRPTAFMEWARAQGATQVTDGLGMLVEQAAESFYIWRKVRPDTAPVIKELRGSRQQL
ncbi:MAG TPA: shikimate dehydrogenase [Gammaproteobacteria bacterium]|jgi:shikimate dehydrogenase|nr:shikimate dehydrogenase [Gammaproteobacteria bacterium]